MDILVFLVVFSPLILFFAFVLIAIIFRVYRRLRKLRPAIKTKGRQAQITEYIMSDEYPYLKRYDEQTIEDMEMELYGESTAELDIEDEDLDN